MRKFINKLLFPIGYELRKVDRFQRRLDELLRSPQGVRFVQVGANDGVRFDGLYAKVTSYRCAGLVIEPLPDLFERLKLNYSDYPNVVAVNKAIHSSVREMKMYRASPHAIGDLADWVRGIASFDRAHLLNHGVPEAQVVEQVVECVPFMELVESNFFLDANVLQVDAEGYDAEVIRAIDFSRFRPRLLKYEHKNLTDNDSLSTVLLLKRIGYRAWRGAEDTVCWLESRAG